MIQWQDSDDAQWFVDANKEWAPFLINEDVIDGLSLSQFIIYRLGDLLPKRVFVADDRNNYFVTKPKFIL